jgi:hypothetical protein
MSTMGALQQNGKAGVMRDTRSRQQVKVHAVAEAQKASQASKAPQVPPGK